MNTDLNDFIQDLTDDLARLRAEAAISCITSTPFIVEVGGLPLKATIENNAVVGVDPTSLAEATRFTRADAEAVAKTVSNGAGEEGRAITYYAAREQHMAKLEGMIARLQKKAK